ncbi:MAG: PolC-type DNA polymerase III [Eubacterium sp.]|nr:PolC-type DNA polymerase III [Eubacterium sp.]
MEEKSFKEVFRGIVLEEKLDMYMDEVEVTAITFVKNPEKLFIDISSTHLISREMIKQAEDAVRLFVFGKYTKAKVYIKERFLLSGQYDVKKLAGIYRDSFLDELRDISYVDYKLVKDAKVKSESDSLIIEVQEGTMAKEKKREIEKYFRDTFLSRFGMNVNVVVKLITKDMSEYEAKKEAEEAEKTEAILEAEGIINGEGGDGDPSQENDFLLKKRELEDKLEEAYDVDANEVELSYDLKSTADKAKEEAQKKKDYKANMEKMRKKNFNDNDCFYGRNVEGDIVEIATLVEESPSEVVVRGQIFGLESREIKKRGTDKVYHLIVGNITDFTDTISFKFFVNEDDVEPLMEDMPEGSFILMKAIPRYDQFAKDIVLSSVNGIKKSNDFRKKREDTVEGDKRIELHLHTQMSEMDAVTNVEKAIQRAVDWGHHAIAITDHGVVQNFPTAWHALDKVKNAPEDFKILYGVEGYFVDDIKTLIMNSHGQSLDSEYVVFDIETTGLSFKFCKIIEIGAVRLDRAGNVIGRFSEFVNPEVPIPYSIEKLTSINDSMVKDADTIDKVMPRFFEFCKDAMLVAHNATFDTTFIRVNAKRLGMTYDFTALDTMTLAYIFLPELGRYNLDRLTNYFKLTNAHHHRACDDAEVTAEIFVRLLKMINESGAKTVDDLNKLGSASPDAIKKAKSYHGIIFFKNETGRTNLYRLVSEAHIKYFNNRPRIPMSLIEKYREGLIVGSACSSGQLYSAILDGAEDEEIERIVRFFDYLEIQPIGNNKYLLENEKQDRVKTWDDLRDINREIVALGEKYDKPVVATGDVHFLEPEDAIYRTIILEGSRPKSSGKKLKEEEEERARLLEENGDKIINSIQEEMEKQPPLYFKTTDEMLEEFSYLGEEKAYEVVVKNTNLVASWMDKMAPVRPDKAPPVIENSDQILRDICNDKMHEIYGPNPPQLVIDRLNKELDSIIGNGYSVMYIIAQKLVWKSNDDGYLVGSRGSVGSSFAATMAGITEVNPLPPHYICPSCYYTEFDSERVRKYSGMSGCDMPDAVCPNCGKPLKKEGHDIPFETFLGFKGDKEPDIDLNFSGEYQPRAHAYIGEIFGEDYSFRAGTVGTVAEKTAIGYVMKYCEARGLTKRFAEIERLAKGCTDVKRTTGQHPGGIIVMPDTEEIYSFTPVQKPANDMTVDTVTTHFDYHSIDHNLLKFDILGHDDPTMIRRLEDLTGLKATDIPLDDKGVMSLFKSTDILGIKPEDMNGVPLGSLGIPEFGTEFAMQMLIDADPQSFSDLVRIAGLAHGTDVWLGNAQVLIQEGKCKLSSAICCRDDIMVYLIYQGLESGDAFNIMEKVRKGLVAKGKYDKWPEMRAKMEEKGVPDWYIWSCEKIKYMFPKAHAVAYVMMSWRVAYFKIYYPLAYYTAYYSIRADAFDYEVMCQGEEHLDAVMEQYMKMDKNKMSAKEQLLYRDMKLVKEMYARGFEFLPIDIYKAKANRFQIIDGKIMPSFASIEGMGDKAAEQLEAAAQQGLFLSQQELRNRSKVSGTVIDKMAELGILGDMPKESQLTFDFL